MANRIDYSTASPDGYKAFAGIHTYLQHCSLSRELVDLVYLRVSLINGCAYCIDSHSRDLLKRGMSTDKLALVPVWPRNREPVLRHGTRRTIVGRTPDQHHPCGRARRRL